jgi:inner membrane protein
VLDAAGHGGLAVPGAAIAVGLATLPDVDLRLPFVPHRGPTHTVWFAGAVAAACGALALPVGGAIAPTVNPATVATAAGAAAVLGHVAADGLTPAGVDPVYPFGRRLSLSVVDADSWTANHALLVLGVGAVAAAMGGLGGV